MKNTTKTTATVIDEAIVTVTPEADAVQEETANPFDFANQTATTSASRKLDLTPVLNGTAQTRAIAIMQATADRPELRPLATRMITDLKVEDLIELIGMVHDDAQIALDAVLLKDAGDDQLSRLLESRRSDRSKIKAKDPQSNKTLTINYIASMYAELMVRKAWDKPYQTNNTTEYGSFNSADKTELTKKIKSLQSKKCHLAKTAGYVAADKIALDATDAEISRLNQLRGTSVKSSTVVKDVNIDMIRQALAMTDPATLDPEALEQYNRLVEMTKVG